MPEFVIHQYHARLIVGQASVLGTRNQPSQKRIANHDGLEFMFRYVVFRSFRDGLRNIDKRKISRV